MHSRRLFRFRPIPWGTACALRIDSVTVDPGEEFTINLALENVSGTSTVGLVGALSGMAAAGAIVTSGQAAIHYFVGFCSPSQCFGGLNWIDDAFLNANDLSAGSYSPGDDSAFVVNTISTSGATSETGAIDPGLEGGINEPSARDVTINLIASIVGTHVLSLGGSYSDGSNVIGLSGPTFTVTVVPEPGSALLLVLVLGLLGLSASRSRVSRECSFLRPDGDEF
jgi:hypothetical protein